MQTFLFTDIEGSTRLWERHPQAMGAAVARHERILREAIGVRGGTVFNTAGDSVCAVFPTTDRAIAAAIDAQRHLLAEPWDTYAPELKIAVRMALDAGDAEASGENFVGPVLNRLHRLMKTGHGGQILCTDSVFIAGDLAPVADTRDLGIYSLRDLPEDTRIFQLFSAGLPDTFPPLITDRPASPNLPQPPNALIGRSGEMDNLAELVRDPKVRLLTLLGPGGVGKTTLALALTRQLYRSFPNGACFVDLSAVIEPDLVSTTIAAVAGTSDPLLSLEDAMIAQLGQRAMLLVLDNCEHVVAEVARIVARLLASAPNVTVLATSRVPLRIRGEWEAHVSPLPLPAAADAPAGSPAVQLFMEHARQVDNSFALDATNESAVVEICRMVDGLPLAIELAAAWIRTLDPLTLRNLLGEGAPLLRSAARDRPERHRTLTSTIDWSYRLLSPDEQWALGRLAVFQGGIPFDGALAVLQDECQLDFVDALAIIETLVQTSLVQSPTQTQDGPRYGMLQTIQEFGISTLLPDARISAHRAHAQYFAGMASAAVAHYRSPEAMIWLDRLDANAENVRAAAAWLSSPACGAPNAALEMATDLWEYFDLRTRHPEARAMLTSALAVSSSSPTMLRMRALALIGHTWLGQYEQAESYYRQSIDMSASIPDADPPFDAITGLMAVAQLRGDLPIAIESANQLLHYATSSDRPEMVAQALLALGQLSAEANDCVTAIACLRESRSISAQLGDEIGLAWIQRAEGQLHFWNGQYEEAEYLLLQAVEALEPMGERQVIALCQLDLAKIAALRSEWRQAHQFLTCAVEDIITSGIVSSTWEAIRTGVIVFGPQSKHAAVALELFAAAKHWSTTTGAVGSPRQWSFVLDARDAALMSLNVSSEYANNSPQSLREAIELLQAALRASHPGPDRCAPLALEA